jgi:hypothetical protein
MIKLRWGMIPIIVMALMACSPSVVDTSCSAFGPITYSAARDTEATVTQVRQHNAAWMKLCK